MLVNANDVIELSISDDGLNVYLEDKLRGCTWTLDGTTRTINGTAVLPLPAGTVHRLPDGTLESRHEFAGGKGCIRCHWALQDDHVAVTLDCTGELPDADWVSWPGTWRPTDGLAEVLVPHYQGILIRPSGTLWQQSAGRGGHAQMSMGMAGVLSDRGGLLITPDELSDWQLRYGETADGPMVAFDARPCPVSGWRPMTMRLCPCASSLTAVAQRYRQWAQRRGQWVPWSEKIAAKPMLQHLFGALMTFIGYVHDDEADYVANTRALRAYGFDSLFIYPVRFAHYSTQFTMAGGRAPIWLSDATIAELKGIGDVYLAPWTWVIEGIDDGSDAMRKIYRMEQAGIASGWSMDNQHWKEVCTPYQIEHIRARLAGDMREMAWLHFDVNATHGGRACWSTEHALHAHTPLAPYKELPITSRLLSVETVNNRVVSSEGFNDAHTAVYDIGSTKALPIESENPRVMVVPLTMLVYHDCCIQDWWEMHNYNTNSSWGIGNPHTQPNYHLARTGAGEPQLKAALDALYGLPPNVFPFGKQYGWVNQACGETYLMTQQLDDPAVQEALAAALPVAKLHKAIGQLAMVSCEFLSEDRYVQRTTFADGTQVVANLGSRDAEVPGCGLLAGKSWRIVTCGQ